MQLECRNEICLDSVKLGIDLTLEIPVPGVTLFVGPHGSGKSILSYMIYHGLGGTTKYSRTIGACSIRNGAIKFDKWIHIPTERSSVRELSLFYSLLYKLIEKKSSIEELGKVLESMYSEGRDLLDKVKADENSYSLHILY